jgi:uncharacterized protein YdcH (DUF465 family)
MVKSKDKKLKKLVYEKEYLDKKVRQMTRDRRSDRSWDAKAILLRLKKQKLKIKEEIARVSEKFIKLTKLK